MMVETMLESSQDFGMSNGSLPQWKREVLQRRAARSRAAVPPPQPPPPPPRDEDEELRYGPGIVKRLKSRYLSLALRDAPRRRPSVLLRRAASLEHLLDERPPPAPRAQPRAPRPASLAAPPAAPPLPPAARRDSVKRARSVDALSRLEERAPSPPPPRPPPQPRAARPPRRPAPLLRDAERPPPDVVRSTLRKFESAPPRRAAPAARVSAVLRGLEGPRTSTPEPRDCAEAPPLSPRTPSPSPAVAADSPSPAPPVAAAPTSAVEDAADGGGARPVSRAALEGIARAGSTVRYAFEAPRAASHLPPLSATNQVLLGRARRVGVIRPMPARATDPAPDSTAQDNDQKSSESTPRVLSPSPTAVGESEQTAPGRSERREPPPSALVEPIPRPPPDAAPLPAPPAASLVAPVRRTPSPEAKPKPKGDVVSATSTLVNGHSGSERGVEGKGAVSRIGGAGIERAWSGSGARRGRAAPAPAPACTSVVFNFSNRKEVPDYIENDGIILRTSRRNRLKGGEAGVVVLRPELALASGESDSESELDGGPPSPCCVRFVNDNVLINGRSSMPTRPDRDRIAKLKLQFDDSLTRTFEYPSETSLCEEPSPPAAPASPAPPATPASPASPAPQLAESPHHAPLADNTHISSAALSAYTPHKTAAAAFQLGVAPLHTEHEPTGESLCEERKTLEEIDSGVDVLACEVARSWSEARSLTTDLLF